MGHPNLGNKAQTPVGYAHDTGVSTGNLATAVTGLPPRVTPREYVGGHMSSCQRRRCRLRAVDVNYVNQAMCGVTAVWRATHKTKKWCVWLMSDS